MTQRRILRAVTVLAAAAVAAGLAACSSSKGGGGGSNKTIRFYLAGDVNILNLWNKTILPGFTKANPGYSVKITFSEHGVNDTTTFTRLGAAVKQNKDPGFDLYESSFTQSAAQAKLVREFSTGDVPNLKNVSSRLVEQVSGRGVPYRGSAVVLAYDSTKVTDPPKTLDDLLAWIKANPGKFTYNSPSSGGSGQAFAQTVLDANMAPDVVQKMYSDDNYDPKLESNWDKGFGVLKSLKSSIYQHVYPNGNQAVIDLLGKGQISMAAVWSDQVLSGLDSGTLPKTTKLTQISNPSFTGSPVYLVSPTTSKRVDAVDKLADYLLEPDVQTQIVQAVKGFPGVEPKYLPAQDQQLFADLDTSNLRPVYSAKFTNDLKLKWQQKVA